MGARVLNSAARPMTIILSVNRVLLHFVFGSSTAHPLKERGLSGLSAAKDGFGVRAELSVVPCASCKLLNCVIIDAY
ncbi:hypothetical protein X777_02125 [Ooceraea biroi]|uniref:Uncharacterized protein n=1 Tax=Ooceraea biroi TaxID=2015173 RepID=A0A026WNH8_OOCBI|nr:hypothetical protein X777_02125 [Ooceraea biroi]